PEDVPLPLAVGLLRGLVPAIADDDVEFAVLVDVGDADPLGAELAVEHDLLPFDPRFRFLVRLALGVEKGNSAGQHKNEEQPAAAFHGVPRWESGRITLELWEVEQPAASAKSMS